MTPVESPGDNAELQRGPHFIAEPDSEQVQAWEEVAAGRFMPRRTRGSCKGRALG